MVMDSRSSEIELALLICADDPPAVADRIAALTELAGYRLAPRPTLVLRDRYFDAPDRALAARGLGLRLRDDGEALWLTLKGPAQIGEAGAARRLELEARWSDEALSRALAELAGHGLRFAKLARPAESPTDALGRLGLEVVQARENRRRVRDAIEPGGEARVAEFAIDAVTYRFGARVVRLHEVEIESKTGAGEAALDVLADHLLAAYHPALRRWAFGKLTTGRAVEALLNAGALEGLMDREHNLTPPAYAELEKYLGARAPLPFV
jgi:inorganic triphosphatase YgiF